MKKAGGQVSCCLLLYLVLSYGAEREMRILRERGRICGLEKEKFGIGLGVFDDTTWIGQRKEIECVYRGAFDKENGR